MASTLDTYSSATLVNAGTATLDFGAFPGGSDARVVVTGVIDITASSIVSAWLFPVATQDHSADEHLVETIKVMGGNVVEGVGFTIYGVNSGSTNEPLTANGGGIGTRIYGAWKCAWQWLDL